MQLCYIPTIFKAEVVVLLTSLQFGYKEIIASYHHQVPYRPLKPNKKKSLNHNKKNPLDDNLIIHGDNLEALKALLPMYGGKVNCIYIDPPYNTGNECWAYNDNVNGPMFKNWFKKIVDSEDLERHDKWCCMMWPRLKILRQLLAEDGIIFISIDDNEQHRLRMMMDEIFGMGNFITQVTWHKKRGKDNSAKFFSVVHDFVVVYAKEKQSAVIQRLPMDLNTKKAYKNQTSDPRGSYRLLGLWSRQQGGSMFSFTTKTGKYFSKRLWLVNEAKMKKLDSDNRLVIKGDKLYRKLFISEVNGSIPETIWTGLSNYANAKDEIKTIFADAIFDTPKPIDLIDRIMRISTSSNDIILDSFAGSGTTAHAVLALNKEDGGSRKFILVEREDYADTITAERVRRIIKGVPNHAKNDSYNSVGTGGSFTYCTMGEPIDINKMLAGKTLPDYSTLASHLLYMSSLISTEKTLKQRQSGLFYSTDSTDYYLLYKPDLKYLQSSKSSLTAKHANTISKKNRNAVVFAADKDLTQRELSKLNIEFCRLPDAILGAAKI